MSSCRIKGRKLCMTGEEIRKKIDFNNDLIRESLSPNIFTLNNTVRDLLEENDRLQKQCKHVFEDGYCIYCYKNEEK